MNDIYTLLTIRDEIYEQYQIAKKEAGQSTDPRERSNARHQWSGLQTALSLVEQKIQAEMDFRDSTAPQDAVLSPAEWENME